MKNIYLIIGILLSSIYSSQVAIGKSTISNSSVSLEFGTGFRGIILPWVEVKTGVTENGSILYDTTDKKVKYLKGGSWFDLSKNETTTVGTTSNFDTTGTMVDPLTSVDGQLIQDNSLYPELTGAKVSIGTLSSVSGILVLEDSDKAMILPKMDSPHLNIQNPAAGMMAYDTLTKQLCIYNGKVWSFWKP